MSSLLWLRWGAISNIYQVNSLIVVKRPNPTGHDEFVHENHIFDVLARSPPCPEIIVSFLRFDTYNFMEYMPGFSLTERLQINHHRDPETTQVLSTQVEPLPLRKTWMKASASGIAWLESLGFAHGDIKPENILIDEQDRIKVADFDCTNTIGSNYEMCTYPYGRILGSEGGAHKGSAGKLGARTEQFSLGSLFYYINYGFEVYDDQYFGKEHGPIIVDKLQNMIFPELNTDPVMDGIIDDCWHNRFPTIVALSQEISKRCDLPDYYSQAVSLEEFTANKEACLSFLQQNPDFTNALPVDECARVQIIGEQHTKEVGGDMPSPDNRDGYSAQATANHSVTAHTTRPPTARYRCLVM